MALASREGGGLHWPLLLAATILVASGRPAVETPFVIPHGDKFLHFLAFGLLGTLVLRSAPVWTMPLGRRWVAIAAVSAFGIADEFRQSFTPGRFVEVLDWLADTLGAAVAVSLYLGWPRYRALLEKPLWTRRRVCRVLSPPNQSQDRLQK